MQPHYAKPQEIIFLTWNKYILFWDGFETNARFLKLILMA